MGETAKNPAHAIYSNLSDLETLGATVVGIACNTAHAPGIRNVFLEKLKVSKSNLRLLDMISETADFLRNDCQEVNTVGVLSTIGPGKQDFILSCWGSTVLKF
ncbi:MAG: hypothetical protein CM1200mP28_08920 [Deltaproteobacteria bacterium]|nr:MAG: hypothetical protein CM1200mP28_08920 [Deltaproteobacteria bacterium]